MEKKGHTRALNYGASELLRPSSGIKSFGALAVALDENAQTLTTCLVDTYFLPKVLVEIFQLTAHDVIRHVAILTDG